MFHLTVRSVVSAATLSFAACLHAQSLSQSQLFFDASGTDQGGFGPNEIITISGNITYFSKSASLAIAGAHPDVFFPVADIYVLPNGYLHTTVSSVPLKDVAGAPNTVIGAGGGGFMEQVIATTQPVGSLPSGEYDVVIDEDQDGFFTPSHDLHVGTGESYAFSVLIPAHVPPVSGDAIAAMKLKAEEQYEAAVVALQAFKFILDITEFLDLQFPQGNADVFFHELGKSADKLGEHFGTDPKEGTKVAMLDNAKKYEGIVADPPDPNYAQLVKLAPIQVFRSLDTTLLSKASAHVANALLQENALAAALLQAIEKFQGTQQDSHGYWALAHAREIQMYASLLATQLARSQDAVAAFQSAVLSDPRDLDGSAANARNIQTRLRDQGFTLAEQTHLFSLGLDQLAIANFRNLILTDRFDSSRAAAVAQLDRLKQAEASAGVAYAALTASIGATVSNLLSQASLDRSQPIARPGGPYTGVAGGPVSFDASASTDPQSFPLAYSWDFRGDGQFQDAPTANASYTFNAAYDGYVGLITTSASGKASVSYVLAQITDSNQPPVIQTLNPTEGSASVFSGDTLVFQATASDPNGDTVTLEWLVDGTLTGSGATFTYSPTASDAGLHDVTVRASDGHGPGGVTSHFWLTSVKKHISVADLATIQTQQSNPVQVGRDIVYAIVVTNAGPDDATGVVLTNLVDPHTLFVSATTSQGITATPIGPSTVVALLGSITNHGSVTLNVVLTAGAAGTFSNTVTTSADQVDLDKSNNRTDLRTRIDPPVPLVAGLSVTLNPLPNPVAISNTVTYAMTVRNAGPNDASHVVLTESLPPGLSFISSEPPPSSQQANTLTFNFASVSGALRVAAPVSVLVHVQPTNSGTFLAVASVIADEGDPDFADNEVSATTVVSPASANTADLGVTLNASTNSVFAGDSLTYTLVVTNQGPDAATGATLTDFLSPDLLLLSAVSSKGVPTVASGVLILNLGTLAKGDSVHVSINAKALFPGPLANRATVSAVEHDPNLGDNSPVLSGNVTASPNGGAATIAIVQNFADPEIISLQGYLAEMGLISQAFDQQGLTFDALSNFKLVVWDDLSYGAGGIAAADVDVYQAVWDAHIPLYFIGDDLALSATYALSGTPEETNWVNLIHLNATSQNYGGNRTFSIVDHNHPVVNGPFGAVGDSNYGLDPDGTTRTGTGEVLLGVSGPNDVLVAFKDPISGIKSITQNVLSVQATDASGIAEKKKLFKNGVTWLLATDPVADLSVSSTALPASCTAGQYLTYSLTVANVGPAQAGNVVLKDYLPPGVVLISSDPSPVDQAENVLTFDLGSVANANNSAAHVTIIVQPLGPGDITNRATVTSAGADPSSANNVVSTVLKVLPAPVTLADISVSQSISAAVIAANSNLVFNLGVSNAGPDTAHAVVLVDPLAPGNNLVSATSTLGTVTVTNGNIVLSIGSLPVGGSAQLAITLRPLWAGTVLNRATISSMDSDLNPANNTSEVQATAVSPKGASELIPYESAGWRFSILKTSDVLPAGFQQPDYDDSGWDSGPAPFGNRGACPLQGTVRTTWPASSRLLARHVLTLPCPVSGLHVYVSVNSSIEAVFFNGVPLLSTSSHVGCPSLDDFQFDVPLGLIRSGPNYVAYQAVSGAAESFFDSRILTDPGSGLSTPDLRISAIVSTNKLSVGAKFTVTFSVTNSGSISADGVTLVDTLPNAFELVSSEASQGRLAALRGSFSAFLGTLTNGANATITLELTPLQPGKFANVASVLTGSCETNTLNRTLAQVFDVQLPVADLAIAASSSPLQAAIGGLLTYSVVVHNNGPDTATGVTLSDFLPAALAFVSANTSRGEVSRLASTVNASLGALTNGEFVTINLVVQPTTTGIFTNRSTVSSLLMDPDTSNNIIQQTSIVPTAAALADLGVSIRAFPPLRQGTAERYVLNVANAGPAAASGVRLTNSMPLGTTLLSSSIPAVQPLAGGVLVFALGSLPSGASTNVEISVLNSVAGNLTQRASVAGNEADAFLEDNLTTLALTIDATALASPDLALNIITATNLVQLGNNWTYIISITNQGTAPATGVVMSNTLPSQARFVSATPSIGSSSVSSNSLVASFGTLAVGASAAITVTLTATNPVVLVTRADTRSLESDADSKNNSAYSAVTVMPPAAVEFIIESITWLDDQGVFLEIGAIPGRSYLVQYSADQQSWTTVSPSLSALGNRVQWIDNGPPKTATRPLDTRTRFYRAVLLPE